MSAVRLVNKRRQTCSNFIDYRQFSPRSECCISPALSPSLSRHFPARIFILHPGIQQLKITTFRNIFSQILLKSSHIFFFFSHKPSKASKLDFPETIISVIICSFLFFFFSFIIVIADDHVALRTTFSWSS